MKVDLTNLSEVRTLKQNLHATFDTPQGKESFKFIQQIGSWWPTVLDPSDTNSIIARDASRRLIGTLQTILDLSPEQIIALANKES